MLLVGFDLEKKTWLNIDLWLVGWFWCEKGIHDWTLICDLLVLMWKRKTRLNIDLWLEIIYCWLAGFDEEKENKIEHRFVMCHVQKFSFSRTFQSSSRLYFGSASLWQSMFGHHEICSFLLQNDKAHFSILENKKRKQKKASGCHQKIKTNK